MRFFLERRAAVVPVSNRLWRHLAEGAAKTTDSHPPALWSEPPRLPPLDAERAGAIRRAVELRALGRERDVRRDFATRLARRARPDRPWLRSLVTALLASARRRR